MDVAVARQVIGSDKVVGLSVETVEAAKQVSVGIVDILVSALFMPHQPKRITSAYWL